MFNSRETTIVFACAADSTRGSVEHCNHIVLNILFAHYHYYHLLHCSNIVTVVFGPDIKFDMQAKTQSGHRRTQQCKGYCWG